MPESTLGSWTKGESGTRAVRQRRAVVTALLHSGHRPRIPFIGLAEGMVGAAFRRAGVSMQQVRRAVALLDDEIGIAHTLASKRLYTDGARILFDYADRHPDEMAELTVVVTQQRVFTDVVRDYLTRIEYASDGWAGRIVLPITAEPVVEVDPKRGFGQPLFIRGGARVQDLRDRWLAGERLADVAADFGVPSKDAEDVLRAIVRPAA